MATKNLGNVAGVVKGKNPPLEADGVTEKRYVLWAKELNTIPISYQLMYFDTMLNDWSPIQSAPQNELDNIIFDIFGSLDYKKVLTDKKITSVLDLIEDKLNTDGKNATEKDIVSLKQILGYSDISFVDEADGSNGSYTPENKKVAFYDKFFTYTEIPNTDYVVVGLNEYGIPSTLQRVTENGSSTNRGIELTYVYEGDKNSSLWLFYKNHNAYGNVYFTNKAKEHYENEVTNKNILVFGTYASSKLINSSNNTIIGSYADYSSNKEVIRNNNVIVGYGNTNIPKKSSCNTIIGTYISVAQADYTTNGLEGYYPIFDNSFITGENAVWSGLWTKESYKNVLKTLGILDEEDKIGSSCNVFIGYGIGGNNYNPIQTNSFQSIWIGNNIRPARFAYKFCGNIFMGNEIYADHPHDRPAGAIVIGNYIRINGRHTLGELAIHNSTHTYTNWNDALIRGNFNTRYLKINGKFIINPQYAEPFNPAVFTKQVVAKPDGTTTLVDLPAQPQIKILKEDYTPTENLEYLDTFTFNLKANTTYKLELGLFGDERILSQCIITDDVGHLSVASQYLIDTIGSWCFFIGTEEELQQRSALDTGLPYNNVATILNYVIRPKSNCTIKIPTKRFSVVPTTSKLLAGTYMKLEPIVEPTI